MEDNALLIAIALIMLACILALIGICVCGAVLWAIRMVLASNGELRQEHLSERENWREDQKQSHREWQQTTTTNTHVIERALDGLSSAIRGERGSQGGAQITFQGGQKAGEISVKQENQDD